MIFNQGATLKVGSLEFVYPDFHMEWNYKVENDNSPSVLEITIFNLSDTNINSMKINQSAIFNLVITMILGYCVKGMLRV